MKGTLANDALPIATDESYPLLAQLGSERVMSVHKISNGHGSVDDFELIEGCDAYYGVIVSRQELRQLGEELVRLADDK